jgi:hypothetical protein
MVAAAGVIIHGTKASSTTVQIFDYNCSSIGRMSYSWTQELSSISIPEGEGESQNMILVALSLVLLWESNGRTCLLLAFFAAFTVTQVSLLVRKVLLGKY